MRADRGWLIPRLAAIFRAAAIVPAQAGVHGGFYPGCGRHEGYEACLSFSIALGLIAVLLILIDTYQRRSIRYLAWVVVAVELLVTWEIYRELLAMVC